MPEQKYDNSSSFEPKNPEKMDKKKSLQTPIKKVIKKRVRNRYGTDTRHMGFIKQYVYNEKTGRANQLF